MFEIRVDQLDSHLHQLLPSARPLLILEAYVPLQLVQLLFPQSLLLLVLMLELLSFLIHLQVVFLLKNHMKALRESHRPVGFALQQKLPLPSLHSVILAAVGGRFANSFGYFGLVCGRGGDIVFIESRDGVFEEQVS